MKVAVFSTKRHDRESLSAANSAAGQPHRLSFFEARLDASTAALATDSDAICPFVNDRADRAAMAALREQGIRLIALRSAGFNNVDLNAGRGIRDPRCAFQRAAAAQARPSSCLRACLPLLERQLTLPRASHR